MFLVLQGWELWTKMVVNPIIYYFFPLRDNDKSNPSTLGLKYPIHRDDRLKSCNSWMKGKQVDDGAEGLWRVHDNLYDLSKFVKQHPGGSEWLELTKGTDITESFQTHHLTTKAEEILPKFFVRKAETPRDSPFTFKEGDFYMTLKGRVRETYKELPKWPIVKSKIYTDAVLFGYLVSALVSAYYSSFAVGLVAALFLYFTAVASHNFFHQKDNIRMYYINFTFMSSRIWRISHVMSHHMFPNTIKDLEISEIEPFLQYLTTKKTKFIRYMSWLYSPIVYSFFYVGAWIRETSEIIENNLSFRKSRLLPFVVPVLMYLVSDASVLKTLLLFTWIILTSSLYFGFIGLNAGHHHPDVFHDGDVPRVQNEFDWGLHQMDTILDKKEMCQTHFLVLTHFGNHTLHHLFPTIDHGLLEYLYPTFLETCKEFGINFRMISSWDAIKGQFQQLARVVPRPTAISQ